MAIDEFARRIQTENKARRYLRQACWKNGQKFCTHCRSRQVYSIVGRRYRCARCGYRFADWTGRFLGGVRISAIKLRACHQLRQAIVGQTAPELLRGEVEADESYFGGRRKGKRGRGAAGKVPVFGILERNGTVRVEVVPNVSAATLLDWTLKKVRRGSIVYTDRWRGYDSLMFCGYRHLRVDHQRYFSRGKVYINGLEGFWSYAKERLAKFHGVSKEKFPLYLKEMEFRYNHRHQPLLPLLVQAAAKLVPNHL
jgi:transposase